MKLLPIYLNIRELVSGLEQHQPRIAQAFNRLDNSLKLVFDILNNHEERITLIERSKKRFRAFLNTSQVIANITNTVIQPLWTKEYGNDDMFNTANGRCTFNTPGFYGIGAWVTWEIINTGRRRIFLRLNGGITLVGSTISGMGVLSAEQNIHTEYKFNQGDYVELVVYQDSGGDLDVLQLGTAFWATMIERRYNPGEIPDRIE